MRDLPRYHRTVSAARRRLLGAISAMALVIVAVGILPASAAERIELEQQLLYGEAGSLYQLAEVTVAPDHVGVSCTMTVHTENQSSVHPGNDLLITTGDSQAVIEGVEAEANAGKDLSAEVVLGETIVVALRFGPEGRSSMGYGLDVDCGTDTPILTTDGCAVSTTEGDSEGGQGAAEGDGTTSSTASTSTTASTATTSTTSTEDDCTDPPVSEVSVPPTTVPETCPDGSGGDGALTVDGDTCPLPTVKGETVESTTTTASTTTTTAPTTASTTTTTAAPTTTTTAAASTAASVLGKTVENLDTAQAATAVEADPGYTG